MEQTAASIDRELIDTQEALVRADRRDEQPQVAGHLQHLAELLEVRTHLPLQRVDA